MSEAKVNSEDIEMVFQRLRALPGNKTCFDCSSKNPTWSSITYGVFICLDCSAVHRSMGVHLTFVRSTQLDTNWTWLQMRQMQLGGNTNATTFFRQHNCISKDAQQKYNSRAAQLYRDKLLQNAKQAMKTYGTQLFLDQSNLNETVEVKPTDFFEQHTSNIDSCYENVLSNNVLSSFTSIKQDNADTPLLREPKVLNDAEQKSVDHKTLLGGRQAHSKRSGLGGKKLGLGAQKVRANFADIEKEAELADKIKFSEPEKPVNIIVNDLHENQISSMRLAYQDLCIKKSKEEEKLKQVDPKKAAQLERLGMGFTSKNIVSHSALNDMTSLDKEAKKQSVDHSEDKFYDCFENSKAAEMLHIITMAKNRQNNSDNFFDFDDSMVRNSKSSYTPSKIENIEKIDVIKNDWNIKPAKKVNKEVENDSWESFENSSRKQGRTNRTKNIAPPPAENNEAFKKFGGAKSISSSQYFGDNTISGEKSNLSRFEGSNSISSAELFGREEITGTSSTYQPPDLDDVKESVKQGVTKVAGKLSSLANGMMSSFQEKYGGY